MKAKLLLIALFGTLSMNAQTTHMVDWFMGVSVPEASMMIDQGDTVTWTWTDNLPHTVTSTSGTNTFNSGTKTGVGQTFSHVFTNAGTTNYHCNVHNMMQGTIIADAVMGLEEEVTVDFKYFPNPTTDVLTLTSAESIDQVDVYDINGRLLMSSVSANPTVKVYMEHFTAGTYFVKVLVGGTSKTISVVKQ